MDDTVTTGAGSAEKPLSLTGAHAGLARELIRKERESLRGLKSNPKGMTHGQVQDRIAACESILAGG